MGGFLTIGYCFLEIFVGGQGLDGGGQGRDGGDPPVLPTGENPGQCGLRIFENGHKKPQQ